jgi:GNAT superfamily N-acetyltransferase
MAIDIIDATDPSVREAVFRFRYDIYVREMRRRQKDADHERQRVEDILDRDAILLAAVDTGSGRVVGTARSNIVGRSEIGVYDRLYGLDALSARERTVTTITTRFMVDRERRGTVLAMQLARSLFARGAARGITTDYIDCNEPLVPFFERLGYRSIRTVEHPDYGAVRLMRLDLRDDGHLARVGSPFGSVQARHAGAA